MMPISSGQVGIPLEALEITEAFAPPLDPATARLHSQRSLIDIRLVPAISRFYPWYSRVKGECQVKRRQVVQQRVGL